MGGAGTGTGGHHFPCHIQHGDGMGPGERMSTRIGSLPARGRIQGPPAGAGSDGIGSASVGVRQAVEWPFAAPWLLSSTRILSRWVAKGAPARAGRDSDGEAYTNEGGTSE